MSLVGSAGREIAIASIQTIYGYESLRSWPMEDISVRSVGVLAASDYHSPAP
ncbi:MAG: hypothetical protein QXZ22_00440 [Sulfolobales archaeon]